MPHYRVIEYHSYTLTFEVEAANIDAAADIASDMSEDEAENEELGCDDVIVEEIA